MAVHLTFLYVCFVIFKHYENGTSAPCSCTDCPVACPNYPGLPPLSEPFMVGSLDGMIFVAIMLFVCLAIGFILGIVIYYSYRSNLSKFLNSISFIKFYCFFDPEEILESSDSIAF